MGINLNYAALLAKAKQDDVCFDKILTIGHQQLSFSQRQLKRLAKNYGVKANPSGFLHGDYADEFFAVFLGTRSAMSVDYSDYQGSDIIHDMNEPIDPSYHEKYDAVIDGGSLEHIFNFPVAVANCMNLVKRGGSLFICTTCNNHAGHGFYQFSPELFFRIFQPANGFAIRDVILQVHPFPGAELSPRTKCYSVADPSIVKGRVGLVSRFPALIMVHAMKTDSKPLFVESPIQSDYASLFAGEVNGKRDRRTGLRHHFERTARKAFDNLPLSFRNYMIGRRLLMQYSSSNKRFYKRWYPF